MNSTSVRNYSFARHPIGRCEYSRAIAHAQYVSGRSTIATAVTCPVQSGAAAAAAPSPASY